MIERSSTRAGFLPARVIHLHPSRFCNLACGHCYSTSGPGVRGALSAEPIVAALDVLRAEGYEVLSLSGGEPLLYPEFEALVRAAVERGFRINLITNGAAVGGRLLDVIAEHVELLAISLDGDPATHNRLRSDPRAFEWAERAMRRLAGRQVRFGLSYCVSRESLAAMPWAVEFAAAQGAALVQFHPFAATGRGAALGERLSLDATDRARAYVVATLLESPGGPAVQVDLALSEAALQRRHDYALLAHDDLRPLALSDIVNPLVVDDLGRLLPLSYGIHPRFALGNVRAELPDQIAHYKAAGCERLRLLLGDAFERLADQPGSFVDWFYHVVQTSYAPVPPVALRC